MAGKNPPVINLDDPEIIAEPVQPDAAIQFWQQRAKLTWDQAKGLSDGAKARAFYVTGLYQQDLVKLVSDGLEEALKNGETLADFKKRITAAIIAQGWHGYRVENIFRTNMQSAYAAGRYKKMQAVKNTRPYWQYVAVMDKRVRPSHAILHEKVYPADHEFWASNYPPNGFRCRCGVITLSERQVKAQGLTVETKMPEPDMWTDPKTGMEYFVHFPGADKGFRNNPGKDWAESGLDLKKYPDVNAASYSKQRGAASKRPALVNTYAELGEELKKRLSPFTRNGPVKDVIFDQKSHFMATNSQGTYWISQVDRPTLSNFNAANDLKTAWNKIARGEKLTFNEEYAIESIWHETVHNREKPNYAGGKDTQTRRMMETVTQWVARRTYPQFLNSIGGKAIHQKDILSNGYGYWRWVRNFDQLRSFLGIPDDDEMLNYFEGVIKDCDRKKYQKEITDYFFKKSQIKVNRKALNEVLKCITYVDRSFNFALRYHLTKY